MDKEIFYCEKKKRKRLGTFIINYNYSYNAATSRDRNLAEYGE